MKFILADPYLMDYSGHCYGYLQSLGDSVKQEGMAATIAGNISMAPDLIAQGATPIFSAQTIQPVRRKPLWARVFTGAQTAASLSFARDLSCMKNRFAFGPGDIVLINSMRHDQMLGLVRWIETVPAQSRPWIIVIFHYTTAPQRRRKSAAVDVYSLAFKRLRNMGANSRCILMADTDELVEEYKELSGLPVLLAPIPHTLPSNFHPQAYTGSLCVSFIGQARPDKGFDLLPQVARNIGGLIGEGKVRLCVQCSTPSFLAGHYDSYIAELEGLGATVIKGSLSEEEYHKLLLDSDVVLLPYSQDIYYRQSSGVFAEAISAGKIIVAPQGTWMGRQLLKMGIGVVYDNTSADALATAVRRAIFEYPSLAERARAGSFCWRQFHNAETFLSIIRDQVKGAA